MRCKNCGAELPDNAYFCSECGELTNMDNPEKTQNNYGNDINTPPEYNRSQSCPNCGSPIKENDDFCPQCGTRLNQKPYTPDSSGSGTGSKKVKLLDQLSINTSYNFLADSMRMQNIGISASTNLLNKLNISGNLNFDPYAIDEKGKRINTFNIKKTGIPARLTNASLSASISFNGKGATDGNDGTTGSSNSDANSYQRIYYHPVTGEYIPGGYLYYMNSNAPWSINASYSFSYSKSYTYQAATKELITNNRFTQTVNLSGNIKLTPRLSIQATSGFDIMAMKITTTQISASYDLHCFNIAVSWVPMGQWKSYSFRIAANASALADLLRFKKSDSYMDNMLK